MEGPIGKTVCVTGANGFIASWLVLKLLKKGYVVHGTVRSPEKCGHLKELEGAEERLVLFKADVLDYESLLSAIRGCHGVFHTACPVALQHNNPEDVLAPAIQGTRNVLTACSSENIKRVVMTSSAAAVYMDPNRPADKILDESCWSNVEYCKETKLWYFVAKTESEKLAWNLAEKHNLELVTICPVWVFGPLLQPTLNTSVELLKKMADGSMESCPNRWIRIVDVRNVADAHIRTFEDPSVSGRYFCLERTVLQKDLVETLKKLFPQLSYPQKHDGGDTAGVPPSKCSNKKLKTLLGEFVPYEQTLTDTIQSLQAKGFLPK